MSYGICHVIGLYSIWPYVMAICSRPRRLPRGTASAYAICNTDLCHIQKKSVLYVKNVSVIAVVSCGGKEAPRIHRDLYG